MEREDADRATETSLPLVEETSEQLKNTIALREEEDRRNQRTAIIYINISAFLQTIQMSMVKADTTIDHTPGFTLTVDPIDLSMFRTSYLALVTFLIICFQGNVKQVVTVPLKHPRRALIFFRALFGAVSYASMVYSMTFLPVSFSTIFINTIPFWTAILGVIFLHEKIPCFEVGCIFGSFAGIIVLALSKEGAGAGGADLRTLLIGIFFALTCAWTYSVVIIFIRKLRDLHPTLIIFFFAFIASCMYAGWVFYDFFTMSDKEKAILEENGCNVNHPRFFCYTRWQYLMILGLSTSNVISQIFQTQAFQKGRSAFISLLQYISVFYAFIVDIVVFKQNFNYLELVGALVLVTFNVASIGNKFVAERKRIKKEKQAQLDQLHKLEELEQKLTEQTSPSVPSAAETATASSDLKSAPGNVNASWMTEEKALGESTNLDASQKA